MTKPSSGHSKFVDTLGVALLAAFLGGATLAFIGIVVLIFTLGEPPIAVGWVLWKAPLIFALFCAAMAALDAKSAAAMLGDIWAAMVAPFTSDDD